MGKSRQTSNDLTLMGVIILKKKERSDGHKIYLCKFPHDDFLWCVIHVDNNGHISDSQCFMWSHNSSIQRKVQLEANRKYRLWCQILMCKIDDFEIGERLLYK